MPTYEYRCSNCGEHTEAFQKMSDNALTTCPKCGKETLSRILSGGAGVLYKGEGWYVTDYSKKSSGGKESSSTPAATTTSETKPDAAQSAATKKTTDPASTSPAPTKA